MVDSLQADGTVQVLYFAWLRERVGTSEEEVILPENVTTARELVAWLKRRSPGHRDAFASDRLIRVAINQEFSDQNAAIKPGDEVAFFPPVTGG